MTGIRIALAVNGVFSYLGQDLLGSATEAFNADGTRKPPNSTVPMAAVRYSNGAMPGSYGFTGQHADAVTGLDYYGARYYDPVAGQFTCADSVLPGSGFNPWGLSRYAYVAGNPETHVDADGHCWPLCTIIIGAVVGAVMGGGADIVSAVVTGQSINWGQVGKDAAVGAVAGAVSGLVGPEAGPLVRAAVDTGAAVAGQVVSNAIDHKPLGDGVLTAAAIGAATEVIHTTANHPWLSADHGWLLAGDLHVGEPVRLLDGGTATVVALRTLPGVGPMWDLTLDSVHTFAVGATQAVVHNCGLNGNRQGVPGDSGNLVKGQHNLYYGQAVDEFGLVSDGWQSSTDGAARVHPTKSNEFWAFIRSEHPNNVGSWDYVTELWTSPDGQTTVQNHYWRSFDHLGEYYHHHS